MKSDSLYLKGEEKFGPIMSRLYSAFAPAFVGDLYSAIVEEVKKVSPKSLLDVGCGPGNTVRMIASRTEAIDLYCVDPSESMIGIARKKITKENLEGRISAMAGSSRSIPFGRKFDMIITSLSYHHWKDREESLEYLLNHLNEGGTLSIFEMNADAMSGLFRAGRSHSLSADYAESLKFPGFRTEVETPGNRRILIARFTKLGE